MSAEKQNCPMKNLTMTIASNLNQVEKSITLLWCEKEEIICQNNYALLLI